jgi:hypothetical protein
MIYIVLVSHGHRRRGDVFESDQDLGHLVRQGYLWPVPEAVETVTRIDEFLDNPESGVKVKRPRRRKEVEDGADPVEPGPGASDVQEQGLV